MVDKKFFVVIALFLVIGAFFVFAIAKNSDSGFFALNLSDQEVEQQTISHHSHPTIMSLQGKVEGLQEGTLGVKVSDQNSCSNGLLFDHDFSNAIQGGTFNLLLGETFDLNLNYNQDYWMCLYVNSELVGGPNKFRGGQGQIHAKDMNVSELNTYYLSTSGGTLTGKLSIENSSSIENLVILNDSASSTIPAIKISSQGQDRVKLFPVGDAEFARQVRIKTSQSTDQLQISYSPDNYPYFSASVTPTGKIVYIKDADFKIDNSSSNTLLEFNNKDSILRVNGTIRTETAFNYKGTNGINATIWVRKPDGNGSCSLDINAGIITNTTC